MDDFFVYVTCVYYNSNMDLSSRHTRVYRMTISLYRSFTHGAYMSLTLNFGEHPKSLMETYSAH